MRLTLPLGCFAFSCGEFRLSYRASLMQACGAAGLPLAVAPRVLLPSPGDCRPPARSSSMCCHCLQDRPLLPECAVSFPPILRHRLTQFHTGTLRFHSESLWIHLGGKQPQFCTLICMLIRMYTHISTHGPQSICLCTCPIIRIPADLHTLSQRPGPSPTGLLIVLPPQ